jgi:hypothetical protein
MARSTRCGWQFVCTLGCAGFLVALPAIMPLHADAPAAVLSHDNDDSQHRRCERHGVAAPTQLPRAGQLQQGVAVTVPATVLVRVDHRGRVLAVATNTGCAPRSGDDMWLVYPDGSMRAVGAEQLLHRRWIGDFSRRGVYVSQVHSDR